MSSREKSFHSILQAYVETLISDREFQEQKQLYSPQPISKEALYYRRIYDRYVAKAGSVIPYYWVPKWTGQENPDPSARDLSFYAEN